MRHRPPQLGPGWGPMAAPPRTPPFRRKLIVPGILLTIGLFTGLTRSRQGLVALLLIFGLYCLYQASRNRRETLGAAAMAALLVVMLGQAGATPNVKVAVDRKAPTERVEKAKSDLGKAREGLANLLDQLKGALPDPPKLPQPEAAPKEHH